MANQPLRGQIGAGPGLPLKTTRERRGAARRRETWESAATSAPGEQREIRGSPRGVARPSKRPALLSRLSCLSTAFEGSSVPCRATGAARWSTTGPRNHIGKITAEPGAGAATLGNAAVAHPPPANQRRHRTGPGPFAGRLASPQLVQGSGPRSAAPSLQVSEPAGSGRGSKPAA